MMMSPCITSIPVTMGTLLMSSLGNDMAGGGRVKKEVDGYLQNGSSYPFKCFSSEFADVYVHNQMVPRQSVMAEGHGRGETVRKRIDKRQ